MKKTVDVRSVRVGDVMDGKLIDGVFQPFFAGEEVTAVLHGVIDETKPPLVWITFGAFRRGFNVDDVVTVVREDDTDAEREKASR